MGRKQRPWSNLKGVLPDYSGQGDDSLTDRQREVIKEADARAEKSMGELAEEYGVLYAEAEADEMNAKVRNITFDAIEKRAIIILEKARAEGLGDMYRGHDQTFSPKYVPRPVVTNPKALLDWIYATGQQDQLTLPGGRLQEIIKEVYDVNIARVLSPDQRAALKPGQPGSMQAPPGVEVYLQTTIHHTSTKNKEPQDDEQ